MDIIFNCPNCDQELAVDNTGAGSEIECPNCGETITIPMESTKPAPTTPVAPADGPASGHSLAPSTISVSAAAKIEKHLKVPVRDTPSERLIAKVVTPLKKAADEAKQLRVHTIRRASCIEAGHDKFDERVTEFLNETGEANIISMHTISYNYFDVTTQKILADYGLIVVYRG
ncbi:MAG TPA: hypothetical protein VMB22_04275 [Verrucomicrobiae bacterium]|nr:hypothetical protein [Verrucomicrobiae bacterium]